MNYSKDSTDKREQDLKSSKKKTKSRIGIILFRIFFIAILTVIFAGGGTVLGLVAGIIKSTPPIDVNQITPEGYATILLDNKNTEITRLSGAEANRIWVDIEEIPEQLQHAFIAIEDERFYQHNGIDFQAILRAVVINLKSRSFSEGGSTLTQQLIKNNVLTPEKSIIRKVQEQYLALVLERELTSTYSKEGAKDIILENYLNTINLGHGAFGVQSAAEIYFNKDVNDLSVAESAVIAAITPNPTKYDPVIYPDNNKIRQEIIIKMMHDQSYITDETYQNALNEDVYDHIKNINIEKEEQSFNSYFVDSVIEDVLKDLMDLGYSEAQANNLIYRGGLTIYTTQDTEIQDITEAAMLNEDLFKNAGYAIQLSYRLSVQHKDGEVEHFSNPVYDNSDRNWGESLFKTEEEAMAYMETFKAEHLNADEGDTLAGENYTLTPQPQASMVIMDFRTGEVKALVGGRGEKKGNRTLNRATSSPRSPGSTFKVLAAYAPALDTAGYTPATILDDVPLTIKEGVPTPYTPRNWYATNSNKYWYKGLSTIREGIVNSMNILAVKTVQDIGIPTAFDYLTKFGFTSLGQEDKVPSLPLGGVYHGVTNLELTAAYGAIANEGVYTEPVLYTKVLDQNGNLILENIPATHTVIKETTAYLLTDMMEDVVNYGTGTRARFSGLAMPIAGKTGTSQESRDLLFTGYTPYYVAGVWTGYDQPMTLHRSQSYHLNIWSKVMEEVHHKKNLTYKNFTKPKGITSAYICTESGKLATALCERDPRGSTARWESFVAGTEPTESCDVHVEAKIDVASGLFATEYCPEESVQTKIFIQRPEDMRLNYEELDKYTLGKIADYQYELPHSMEGEYCPLHGPHTNYGDEDEEDIDLEVPEFLPIPPFGREDNKDKDTIKDTPKKDENSSDMSFENPFEIGLD